MKKVKIEINTSNAAFEEGNDEVVRILRDLADKFECGSVRENILDINGNKVGKVVVR